MRLLLAMVLGVLSWGQVGLCESAPKNPLHAKRAFGYLERLCALGPRPSGSPAMERQRELLTKHFAGLGGKLELQRFTARNPLGGAGVPMANLIVRFGEPLPQRVLLCAHYDTRPLPDRDPNPLARRSGRFLGANDGASGAALLMELAHFVAPGTDGAGGLPGVDFCLFDGEELVYTDPRDPYFLGSTWFARDYKRTGAKRGFSYKAAVLLDMVGDADLQIYQEVHSVRWHDTQPIVAQIWGTAQRLGVKEFIPRAKHLVRDDHLPLRSEGRIPACDLIDFDYPAWHTEGDVPGRCSGESLAKVGWVVLEWLRQHGAPSP